MPSEGEYLRAMEEAEERAAAQRAQRRGAQRDADRIRESLRSFDDLTERVRDVRASMAQITETGNRLRTYWESVPSPIFIPEPHGFGTWTTPPTGEAPVSRMTVREESNMPEEIIEPAECAQCEGTHERMSLHWVRRTADDRRMLACSDCRERCHQCSEYRVSESVIDHAGERYCDRCIVTCQGCDGHITQAEVVRSGGGDSYCVSCCQLCDECDTNYATPGEDECRSCSSGSGDNGIIGYQRTRPFVWLGGPVKKRGGYYIGFELEITAPRNGVPVHKWSKKNLGHADALQCKTDSSVQGFEIASQPMTPAFFESVDWDSFFEMLNAQYPLSSTAEPTSHGLHVHIGRAAFNFDDLSIAAYAYLLTQDSHLERISRRAATGYCDKITKPVSQQIVSSNRKSNTKQADRIRRREANNYNAFPGRGAVNFSNSDTLEIRSFRSTRSPQELKDAVRLVYLGAEYVRWLRRDPLVGISPKALHWNEFAKWVAGYMPEAFESIAGVAQEVKVRKPRPTIVTERIDVAQPRDAFIEEDETSTRGSLAAIQAGPSVPMTAPPRRRRPTIRATSARLTTLDGDEEFSLSDAFVSLTTEDVAEPF